MDTTGGYVCGFSNEGPARGRVPSDERYLDGGESYLSHANLENSGGCCYGWQVAGQVVIGMVIVTPWPTKECVGVLWQIHGRV